MSYSCLSFLENLLLLIRLLLESLFAITMLLRLNNSILLHISKQFGKSTGWLLLSKY
ncbi:MAG: hypothetical protein Q8L20_10060 [Gammaproteobacteria bacterium]|nr:hypothetical protein [Gammaproteobacteria bacterium]